MGRGGSKAGGSGRGGGAQRTVATSDRTINELNNLLQQDSTRLLRERLEQIPNGTSITLYSPERDRNGNEIGVNPDSVVSFRKRDGQWEQTDGPAWSNQHPTDGDMARRAMNNHVKFYPGVGSTESRVVADGRTRTVEGVKVTGGTYDIMVRGQNSLFAKRAVKGSLTEINGVRYGIQKTGNEYSITHIDSGILVNNSRAGTLKTMSQAVNYLKNFTMPNQTQVESMVRRFRNTFRED